MNINFKDKNIIVVGGAGLIGSAVCCELAESEANIIILDINDKALKTLCQKIKKRVKNQKIVFKVVNAAREKEVKKLIPLINKYFSGKIHGLVNCVQYKSTSFFHDIRKVQLEELEDIFEANVFSVFFLFKHLFSFLKKAGNSSIVNFSSTYAIVSPNPAIYKGTKMGCPATYVATKGAIHSLTKYLASYFAKDNIRVNSVTPHGVFDKHEKKFIENFSKFSPMGRMSLKEEVVPAVLFLLSDKSTYITGANLKIDGGRTAW